MQQPPALAFHRVGMTYPDGTVKEIPAVKEDTPENTQPQQGSQLPDTDTTTPATEAEEEVEVEEDE